MNKTSQNTYMMKKKWFIEISQNTPHKNQERMERIKKNKYK